MPRNKSDGKHGTIPSGTGDKKRPAGLAPSTTVTFPVVGIGASAGGLEALKAFFSGVPEESGMGYLVLVHLAPAQPSLMTELLQRVANIPVKTAEDGEPVRAGHVYVVPPNRDISVYNGTIQLMEKAGGGSGLPIDFFLKSLARDQESNAVAVILSGTGTDGTRGVRDIKAGEGLVVVQSEESAAYGGMPRSAIETGVADMILPPGEMPERLRRYFSNLDTVKQCDIHSVPEGANRLNKIYALLRTQIGHDFSLYKKNTVLRRIDRRMSLNQINDPDTYIRFLRENPKEAEGLFRELLIGVTGFFRDPASFESLEHVLTKVFAELEDDTTFRVWVPGCSTGEEAYSLAMIFRERMDGIPKRIILQLFGTDIDKYAIAKAREGLFPESIAADVGPDRLNRFFVKEGHFFRVRKEIRDSIVFSVQDILKDPPFSRLHLLCCRNLLIYLDIRAQKKLLPLFHYTLGPKGILVLGSSKTIGEYTNLFHTLDNKWKIFRRRESPGGVIHPVEFPSGLPAPEVVYGTAQTLTSRQKKFDIGHMAQQAVLDCFSPAAVLVDSKGMILHIVGQTGKYLEVPSGSPTQNVLDMAREGLRIELSSALRTAVSSARDAIRRSVHFKTNGDVQSIDLHICPLVVPGEPTDRFLIVFKDLPEISSPGEPWEIAQDRALCRPGNTVGELEKELQFTRESHLATVEELESSNEELKSACEELQSSNEELQSTNEELESSREELQSVNEELQTVNSELQSKLEELSSAQDDMNNLLDSTEIATVFVDNAGRVKRFTQQATMIVNLIPTDVGRPLQHVVTNLTHASMMENITAVLKRLTPRESEVQTLDGKWYNMRIIPYRTMENRIDGAVLTFTNIDEQKKAQEVFMAASAERERALMLVRDVFDMNSEPLAVVDGTGIMVVANTALSRAMDIAGDRVPGYDIFELADGSLKQTGLKLTLEKNEEFHDMTFELDRSGEKSRFSVHGRKIGQCRELPPYMLLHFEENRTGERIHDE